MRITKKMLKQVKQVLHKRLKEIAQMDDENIKVEFHRCFPHRGPEQTPAFIVGLRMELVQDCVDRALPDHWCD